MDLSTLSNYTSDNILSHTEGYILSRVFQSRHMRDGIKLCKQIHIPYLELTLPANDTAAMVKEAMAVKDQAVVYRAESKDVKALCIHGSAPHEVLSFKDYGYKSIFDVRHSWTSVADQCPVTTAWLKNLLTADVYREFHRVRFMWLEPGAYVRFYNDRIEGDHALGPLVLPLHQPDKSHYLFKRWGKAPLRSGHPMAIDVSYEIAEWNNSSEPRLHLVMHGDYGPAYYQALVDSVAQLRPKAEAYFQSQRGKAWLKEQPLSIAYAVWKFSSDNSPYKDIELKSTMTSYFLKTKSQKREKVLADYSLSRILTDASQYAQWCAVLMPGQIPNEGFYSAVDKLARYAPESTILFADFIETDDGLKGMKEQMFLINIKKWKELGSPAFSMSTLFGANIIEQATRWNYTFENLPQSLKDVAPMVQESSSTSQNKVNIFDTDPYWDVECQKNKQKLNALFTLASGFKDLFILKQHHSSLQASITYFSSNKNDLLFKQYLYENWDGVDLPSFTKSHRNQLSQFNIAESDETVAAKWDEELQAWGGHEIFHEVFSDAKTLKKQYIHVDLINDATPLLSALEQMSPLESAVWYGGLFTSTAAQQNNSWDVKKLETSGMSFLMEIHRMARRKNMSVVLYGDDVLLGVKCITANDIAKDLFG